MDVLTDLPGRYTLGRVRVLQGGRATGLVDLTIAGGRIEAVAPGGSTPGAIDLQGRIASPGFVDMHTHLDKGHIWPRAANPDGTHAAAARSVAADRRQHWSAGDIARRFDFALRCALAHGTVAMRTHLDCYDPGQAETAFEVFAAMREAWRDRIALQPVVMTRIDRYQGAGGARLAALAARHGGALGGIVKAGDGALSGPAAAPYLDMLFRLADRHGLGVDLHVDETGDPGSAQLRAVAEAVLRTGFAGPVACGHCCSLAVQPRAEVERTIARVAEAGITVVTLPMVNLYLQDRTPGITPRWRGIAPVQELRAAGVQVAAASDNCRDPFFAFGDHDMLEVLREAMRIGHLDMGWQGWSDIVSAAPARAMGLDDAGALVPGAPADLVLFRARDLSELLARPQSDRIVLRGGRRLHAELPDYAELDPLFARTEEIAL